MHQLPLAFTTVPTVRHDSDDYDTELQEGSWCVNKKQLHVDSLTFELLDLSKSGHQADTQPQKVRCSRHLPAL